MRWNAANCVTLSRFVFAAGILLAHPGSGLFWTMYALGAGSDVLDGQLARVMRQQTDFGARLDSWADAAFFGAVLASLFRGGVVPAWGWALAGAAFCMRLAGYVVGAFRFHTFAALHTWGNKLTGALLAALPISAELLGAGPAAALTGTMACLSAMEELALLVKMPELDRDVQGLRPLSRERRAKM